MAYADDLQAVSVDEALIDVTSTVAQMRVVPTGTDGDGDNASTDIAKELADSMRAQIKSATGCNGTWSRCFFFRSWTLTSCLTSYCS